MFASAFLMFAAEPMVGKMVLPTLGGTPGVWNTCLLFFQAMLLAGYAYAFLGSARLSFPRQAIVHSVLLISSALVLPIAVPLNVSPGFETTAAPGLMLFGRLLVGAGLPMLAIAATVPLLQHWFSLTGHEEAADPYFLYAASNAGSLLALAAYPFLIERHLTLALQRQWWSIGFLGLVGLILVCATLAWRQIKGREQVTAEVFPDHSAAPDAVASTSANRPSWRSVASWVGLAFIPSSWLLGVTAYVTTDLAAIPLLWTIPLGIYLLTFILAFSRSMSGLAISLGHLLPLAVVPLVMVLASGVVHLYWIPLHWFAFFLGALVCHGRLAASRPGPEHATAFYLAISAGGVLGGIFNALLAPSLFDRLIEYPLAIVLACLVSPALGVRAASIAMRWSPRPRKKAAGIDSARLRHSNRATWMNGRVLLDLLLPASVFGLTALLVTNRGGLADSALGIVGVILASGLGFFACLTGLRRPIRFALTACAVLLAASFAPSPGGRLIHRERNFFGTLRVMYDAETNANRLFHGSTLHGQQSLNPLARFVPSTYFTRSGPIGSLFEAIEPRSKRRHTRVAIVGLGVGTLGCYAQTGQKWTFYEIDPAVLRIAENPRYFTYLADCRARGVGLDFVLGDARVRMREAPDHGHDLIVLYAFSSDAVPVHLLSREAIRLYRSKLAEGGMLVFNIANRYLDLDPVLGLQAADAGLVCRVRYDIEVSDLEKRAGKQGSIWVVMASRESDLDTLAADPRWRPPVVRPGATVWTDDYSDMASSLALRPGWLSERAGTKPTSPTSRP